MLFSFVLPTGFRPVQGGGRGAGRAGPPTRTGVRRILRPVELVADGDAHLAGGAGDDLVRGVEVVRVEVGELDLGDLTDVRLGDRRDLLLVRHRGALVDARGLEDQASGRRGLGDEVERAVFVDRDLDGD